MRSRTRLSLLIAVALPLAVSGCGESSSSERPVLLSADEASVGDLTRLPADVEPFAEVQRNNPVDMTIARHSIHCNVTSQDSPQPRLTIGEPACEFQIRDAPRVD